MLAKREHAAPRLPPWPKACRGKAPAPLGVGLLLTPLMVLWTLPQTTVGLVYACYKRLRGQRWQLYGFGPFLFVVVPAAPWASQGISLGLVVFADRASILTHEFCHLYTALWLGWAYLPVYGLEYGLVGHDRSPHERLTCRFERRCTRAWVRLC